MELLHAFRKAKIIKFVLIGMNYITNVWTWNSDKKMKIPMGAMPSKVHVSNILKV